MFKRDIISFACFFVLLFSSLVFAQKSEKWVTCSGEAAIQNISFEEAKAIALKNARTDAIEQVCGINLQTETMVKNFRIAADFIYSISYGHVVEEKEKEWKTITLPSKNPDDPPTLILRVSMKAKVALREEKPDPSFKVILKLNRAAFQSGDDVFFKIKATKDCYVTIFDLAANDSVYILFPNKFADNNFLKRNSMIEIPNEQQRREGFHIRVATLPGAKRNSEIVKVIATKERIDFIDDMDMSSVFSSIGTPKIAITKLAQWLSQIPISERAEASASYIVEAREE